YEINQVLVDGVNNVSAVSYGYYTFSNVTANHTISVSFKQSCIPNLVVQVWDDVLSVINQPANNGGYTFVSYQWQRNGVDIPGETFGNLYLPVVDNAQYVVLLTTNNGQKLRSCPVYLHPVTSKAISAYPNPTKGALTIESDEIQAGDIIEIYTVTGTLVRQYPAEAKQTILNVASLSKGIYFVKVNNERIKLLKINK
ncbi:MAG: T9SS type A sorting domain-containing protein, partial [Candidatus Azobacteroides sp.]|nr:T9SS type A sorting domain-containing protein [Candidatus Azobacteroides sp.]